MADFGLDAASVAVVVAVAAAVVVVAAVVAVGLGRLRESRAPHSSLYRTLPNHNFADHHWRSPFDC